MTERERVIKVSRGMEALQDNVKRLIYLFDAEKAKFGEFEMLENGLSSVPDTFSLGRLQPSQKRPPVPEVDYY
jgi:hypothetical protein